MDVVLIIMGDLELAMQKQWLTLAICVKAGMYGDGGTDANGRGSEMASWHCSEGVPCATPLSA